MKKLFNSFSLAAIALNIPFAVQAKEKVQGKSAEAVEQVEADEVRLKRAHKEAESAYLRMIETLKYGIVLDLGDADYLKESAASINKMWVERIEKLDFTLTPEQKLSLLEYLQMNKSTFIQIALTGNVPMSLWDKMVEIVPDLKVATVDDKLFILGYGGNVIQKMVFQSMADIGIQIGSMTGNRNATPYVQLDGKLFTLNAIKVGSYILHDLHVKVKAGYPQTGIGLLSGKLAFEGSPRFSLTGRLLGYVRDFRRESHNAEIIALGGEFSISPYALIYGEFNTGYRTYDKGYVDGVIGANAHVGDKDQVHASLDGSITYESNYARSDNKKMKLRGTVKAPIVKKRRDSFVSVSAEVVSEVEYNTKPGPLANDIQWFNGFGISGSF